MPQFLVTSPDGRKFNVTAPEGSTQEQAIGLIKTKLGIAPPPPPAPIVTDDSGKRIEAPPPPPPPSPLPDPSSRIARQNPMQAGLLQIGEGLTGNNVGELAGVMQATGQKMLDAPSDIANLFRKEQKPTRNWRDVYRKTRGNVEGIIQATQKQQPLSSLVNQVGGGLMLGSGLSAAGAGQSINAPTAFGRIAQAGKNAIPFGALYSGGASEVDSQNSPGEFLGDVAKGSAASALLGAGTQGVFSEAPKAIAGIANKALNPKYFKNYNADQVKEASQIAYQQADDIGGVLKPDFTNKFIKDAKSALPQTEAGKLLSGDNKVTNIVERIESLKDRKISLKEAQEIDEFLGEAIDDFVGPQGISKQGKRLIDIQESFRNLIDDADESLVDGGTKGFEAWKNAKSLWSTQAKMREVEKIISRAEMTDNPASALKSGFRALASNPSRLRGYPKDVRVLVEQATKTGITGEALRTLGSRLLGIITTATGTGGVGGAVAAQGVSMAARKGLSQLQLAKASRVNQALANRAMNPVQPDGVLKAISNYKLSDRDALIQSLLVGQQTAP